jgi:hypothetical protein
MFERNCKVVYKHEGNWTWKGHVGKLWAYQLKDGTCVML